MQKNIGEIIKEHFEASQMEATAFAKAINRERSNVYNIFKRNSIDTELLKIIGRVLKHDFFEDLLEEETKQMLMMKKGVTKKILLEIELTEEEIESLNINGKIIKILNK
jgi:plasmid maintenance system antidote protein VapI